MDVSVGVCLPLLPPVCRLINNGNAAAPAKVWARRKTTPDYFCPSQTFCKRNKPCDPSVLLDTSCFPLCVSPGGRLPGSAVKTRQRRISVRTCPPIAQEADGERQPQGLAAGSQQTEERDPDRSQRGAAAGGGDSAAAASVFHPAGRPGRRPPRPIGSLQRAHKGQDSFVQHVHEDAVGTSSRGFDSRANVALLRSWKTLLLRSGWGGLKVLHGGNGSSRRFTGCPQNCNLALLF